MLTDYINHASHLIPFKSRIFPIKNINIDDDHYVYNYEFDPSKTPKTLPVVLDAPALSKRSTPEGGIKILHPEDKCC